jgi:hypothetical protein
VIEEQYLSSMTKWKVCLLKCLQEVRNEDRATSRVLRNEQAGRLSFSNFARTKWKNVKVQNLFFFYLAPHVSPSSSSIEYDSTIPEKYGKLATPINQPRKFSWTVNNLPSGKWSFTANVG